MIKKPLFVVRVAAFCLPLALVASCGGGDGSAALPGNTITIQATTTTWNVAFLAPAGFQTEPVLISLKSRTGFQLGTNDIHVLLDLSPGTYTGPAAMRLFDETSPGSNNYTTELVTMPYTTQTDASGNKVLMLTMDLTGGSSYKGVLYVYSGSVVGTSTFEVKCVPTPGVTPAPC